MSYKPLYTDVNELLFSAQRLGDAKGAVGTVDSSLTMSVAIRCQFLLVTGHKKCSTSLECEYTLTRATMRAQRVETQTQVIILHTISGRVPSARQQTRQSPIRRAKKQAKTRQNTHVYLLQFIVTVSRAPTHTNQHAATARNENDFLHLEHFTQLLKAG